jgi:hypothetical protein
MRRLASAVLTALVVAGPAAAAGGKSIASAPVLRPGVAASGDTSKDETGSGSIGSDESQGCWNDLEYWRLGLAAGDQVLIKGTALSPAHHFGIGLFLRARPTGTSARRLR